MFEIGSSLRAARMGQGLELSQAEHDTRIRARYLGALEDERFDVLPGPAYTKGRGRCWLSVRRGSATGRSVYEGTLEQGRTARFSSPRLWIRIGAPWNVDATLNGKAVQLPASTGDLVVTPAGLTTPTR